MVSTFSGSPVIAGPRWYRARLRSLGPFVALVPPALLGAAAWLVLQLGEGRTSGLVGLVAGVIAAPGLLVAGAPFGEDAQYAIGILASIPLWVVIGVIASRRATRSPMATWRDYWREYTYLAAGVAIGAVGALVAATVLLGESLIV